MQLFYPHSFISAYLGQEFYFRTEIKYSWTNHPILFHSADRPTNNCKATKVLCMEYHTRDKTT